MKKHTEIPGNMEFNHYNLYKSNCFFPEFTGTFKSRLIILNLQRVLNKILQQRILQNRSYVLVKN